MRGSGSIHFTTDIVEIHIGLEMNAPTDLGAQPYFHTVVLISREVEKNKLINLKKALYITLAGRTIPDLKMFWNALTNLFCIVYFIS